MILRPYSDYFLLELEQTLSQIRAVEARFDKAWKEWSDAHRAGQISVMRETYAEMQLLSDTAHYLLKPFRGLARIMEAGIDVPYFAFEIMANLG